MAALIRLLLTSIVAACLCSCANPSYGITGLTLPPGSKLIRDTHSPVMYKGEAHPDYVGVRLVYFNNQAGWDAVAQDMDSKMKRAGYAEILDNPLFTKGATPEGMQQAPDMVRMYEGPGKFTVTLTNESELGVDEVPTAQFLLRIKQAK